MSSNSDVVEPRPDLADTHKDKLNADLLEFVKS